VGAVGGRGRGTNIKTKANCCGTCYYSIMLDAHRVTSMANTDIDAVQKRKNAERIKQYRLKRKLLTSTETEYHTMSQNNVTCVVVMRIGYIF
jgi:hypothetical protein